MLTAQHQRQRFRTLVQILNNVWVDRNFGCLHRHTRIRWWRLAHAQMIRKVPSCTRRMEITLQSASKETNIASLLKCSADSTCSDAEILCERWQTRPSTRSPLRVCDTSFETYVKWSARHGLQYVDHVVSPLGNPVNIRRADDEAPLTPALCAPLELGTCTVRVRASTAEQQSITRWLVGFFFWEAERCTPHRRFIFLCTCFYRL